MASQRKKEILHEEILKFLKRPYVKKNFERFVDKTLFNLSVKKSQENDKVLKKWQKAIVELKEEDRKQKKRAKVADLKPLIDEARKLGFKGAKSTVTKKKLAQVIEKKMKKEKKEKEKKQAPMKYKMYLTFFTNPLTEQDAMYRRGRKNPIGLEHHMTKEGERYQQALSYSDRSDWQEIIESTQNLIEMYEPGYMVQHYVNNIVNGEITKVWKSFFESFGQTEGREFDNRFDSLIDAVRYIRVDLIDIVDEFKEVEEKEKGKLLKQKFMKQKNYDSQACSSVYPWIKIDYDRTLAKDDVKLLFKPKMQSEHAHKKEKACVLDILIETFGKSFLKYQKTNGRRNIKELTYDYLMELFNIDAEETDLGLSLDVLIEKWFKPNRLALLVFDKLEGVVGKYHPSDDGKRINKNMVPQTLYLLASNQHLEVCNDHLKTLQQIATRKNEMCEAIEVSENFHLPKEQNKVPHIILDHFYEIRNIKWDEIKSKRLNITVQETSLAGVFSYLRDTCNIMPLYQYKGHDILSSVTFKVDELMVTVRNPENDIVLGQLKFRTDDDNKQYETFQYLKFKMNESVMNPGTLSHFNDLDILVMCAPKAIKYRIRKDLETTHYVDKIKAYTECLLLIENLAVANKFDMFFDYSEFKGEPLRDEHFYLVQRTTIDGLSAKIKNVFLLQAFSMFRGFELKSRWEDIKDNIKILGCYTITNLVDNGPAKAMIENIYESVIISEKQKKFICNMVTGMVEKAKNTERRCVLVEDRDEAEALAIKYGATVTPFRYVLAGDITDQEYIEFRNALPWNFSWEEEYVVDMHDEDWYTKVRQRDKLRAERAKSKRELWSVELKKTKPLANGFYFIKLQIYSIMRAMLTKMYEDVEEIGGIPTAVNTDCIFFHLPEGIPLSENMDIDGSKFANIGKYKWRKLGETVIPVNSFVDLMNPMLTRKLAVKEHIYNIRERMTHFKKIPMTHSVTVLNEHMWKSNPTKYIEEVIQLIENGPRCVIIQGESAGAGKTFVAAEYGKKMQAQNRKVMAVGPTTKRAKELRGMIGEENAMTLHKLLKMRVKNGESVDNQVSKVNPLDGVDVLIIDEIFALPIKMLAKVQSKILDKFPNLKVIATGDPFQSRVCDVTVHDIDNYYKNVVASMFSYGILLQINKRMATNQDCTMLNDIKHSLMNSEKIPHVEKVKSVQEITERHIKNGTFTGQILCYYRDTSKYVSKLIQDAICESNPQKNWRLVEGMQLCEGQELINKVWWKAQGKVLNINDTFVVSRIYDYVEMELAEGETEGEGAELISVTKVG